jgi:hypothetical protein
MHCLKAMSREVTTRAGRLVFPHEEFRTSDIAGRARPVSGMPPPEA